MQMAEGSSTVVRHPRDEIWAITCYFNPCGYRRRRQNYQVFRRHLDLPLITVELSYGDFELSPAAADLLIQLRGHDVMWQKERLLNVACAALPSRCRYVVWLDCDLVYLDADWPQRTAAALQHCPLVQPFSEVREWGPGGGPLAADRDVQRRRSSLVAMINSRQLPTSIFGCSGASLRFNYAPGFAWAAHKWLLERHRLYDAMILGSGDKVIAGAAFGQVDRLARSLRFGPPQQRHFRDWADAFHRAVGTRIGHVDAQLGHLWHGKLCHRGYSQRHIDFARFKFDPYRDITVDDASGCWRWNSSKPAMHRYVRDYFTTRREDG